MPKLVIRYDDEDDEPVDGYNYQSVVKEYNDAWKRIKTHSDKPGFLRTTKVQYCERTQQIMDAANHLYHPGEVASPSAIAEAIGSTRFVVSRIILRLKGRGEWPFLRGRIGISYRKQARLGRPPTKDPEATRTGQ